MTKSQIISMDLVMSIVLLLFFLLLIFGMLATTRTTQKEDFVYEYVFDNFEKNVGFFEKYRVDHNGLVDFANENTGSIDSFIIGMINTKGIGLSEESIDSCLYFTDTDREVMVVEEKNALGVVGGDECDDRIKTSSPCHGFNRAISLSRPVLIDYNDPDENRIILMHVLLCLK
jgi:hypothetical protein